MPELPEVETVVRQLRTVLPGKTIQSIEILKEKSLQGQALQVAGKKILSVTRKQKIIALELADDLVILVHLKMTGQLIYESNNKRVGGGHPTSDWIDDLPSKHTRVIFHFTDGSTLYFNDQRCFGWVKVIPNNQWQISKNLMPPDVVDDAFTKEYLKQVLSRSRRAVKLVILDQDKIGGMGNIYANDALYLAGIDPKIPSNQLKTRAVNKLFLAMKRVIEAGIAAGGASYSHFVDTSGLGGHYQDQFLVYDREGEPCEKCGSLIKKFSLGGRGTYYCPKCQPICRKI